MYLVGDLKKIVVVTISAVIVFSNLVIICFEAEAYEGALTDEQVEFVEKFFDICSTSAIERNLAWQTPMAQAIIESGSGTSNIAKKHHNFHGITSKKGGYKHFNSDEEGWVGYFKNLEATSIYGQNGIFETEGDPYEMLDVLIKSGYAEAENYKKVIGDTIKLVQNWYEQSSYNVASDEKSEIIEKSLSEEELQKVKDLSPTNGYAGFWQIIHEAALSSDDKKRDKNNSDRKSKKERQALCRSFLCKNTKKYMI